MARELLKSGLVLPRGQPLTDSHIRCVANAFRRRAAELRTRLSGDALLEAKLSPEEHVAIQEALARRGLLQNRQATYGVNMDGQFGPNTRAAIKDFQRRIGAQPTGFLSEEQRLSLLETPEMLEAKRRAEERAREGAIERERRRLEAEAALERAKQEALEAKQKAEAKARQDAIENERRHLEAQAAIERARQEALEARMRAEEQAKQEAIALEKKRLEEAAAKAAAWRQKIDEARSRGAAYAKENDLKWSLVARLNPMTDKEDYTVNSDQSNETGALAAVEGSCVAGKVKFTARLTDAIDTKAALRFGRSGPGHIVGKKRVNDASAFAVSFPLETWSNQIVLSLMSFEQDDPESADTTWRLLAELETSRGTLYIKIPMLDPKLEKLGSACRH